MVMLNMQFMIPGFAVKKLFTDYDGKVNYNKIQAFYDEEEIAFLRDFPGLRWKIWSVSRNGRTGYGFYLFEDEESAMLRKKFAHKFYWRKGMMFVRCHISYVLEDISLKTKAQLGQDANPPATDAQAKEIMSQPIENLFKKMKRKVARLKDVK